MARRIGSDPDAIRLPPAEQLQRLPKVIAEAGAEVARLREQHRTEHQNLTEAEHALEGAAQADTQAAADALRQKKPAPARTATAKAQKVVDDLKPKVKALEVAASDAERDLKKAVSEHAEREQVKLAEVAEKQQAECKTIAEALVEKTGERRDSLALRGWLDEPTREFRPGAYGGQVAGLLKPNGDPYRVVELVAEVATVFAPPPAAPTNPAQKLSARP